MEEIVLNSPAESRIKIGDTIIKINERIIFNTSDFMDIMNTTKPGVRFMFICLVGPHSLYTLLSRQRINQKDF